MNAGELDKKIQLLRPYALEDQLGAQATSYRPAGNPVWAKVEAVSGSEAYFPDASKRAATQRRRFTVRYRSDVDPTWRLEFDGSTYDIVDVLDVPEGGANRGRRRWLALLAEAHEVGAGGDA